MRKLFFVIAIAVSFQLCAQDEKPPSKSEMQAQMKQTLTDAKKQREDVRKQLAEAKAKNEDAESIKQLEDQLAMLDNMISQLEKVNPLANMEKKTLPVSKIKEPVFISPFTPIPLKSPVVAPTETQAKDELLWFKGKKINANTLITTTGTVVQYNTNNYQLTIQPDKKKDSTYYGLVKMLSQLQMNKRIFTEDINKDPNAFFMFPEIDAGYEQYDFAQNQFYDFAKNTIDFIKSLPYLKVESMMIQLQKLMKSLSPTPNYPALPKFVSDICFCDPKAAETRYMTDITNWVGEFRKDEDQIWGLYVHMHWMRDDLNKKYGPRPDPPGFGEAATDAEILMIKRYAWKLKNLTEEYQKGNAEAETPMTMALLNLNALLLQLDNNADPGFQQARSDAKRIIGVAQSLISGNTFRNYVEQQKVSKNFAEVFNWARDNRHELNRQAIDPQYKINTQQWQDIMDNYNHFSLSIKMDFEYQNVQKSDDKEDVLMIATGSLESDKMMVGVGMRDCKLQLYIKTVNNKNLHSSGEEFKIPMNITGGIKDYTKDKYPAFNYTGPPTMRLLFPAFRLSFCSGKSDVKMNDISYLPSDLKIHEHDDLARMYTTDMFTYANKMLVVIKKTQVDVGKLIQSSIQGINMGNSAIRSESTGAPAYDQMKENYDGNKKRIDLQYQIGNATQGQKAIVDLGVIDPKGSPTLIKQQVDLADPNDPDRGVTIFLRHGYLTIELVHTPK